MSKAIVVPNSTSVDSNGVIRMYYSCSVLGPPNYDFGSDYVVNTEISVANNITAWRNKIIAQVAESGVTIVAGDVILFGLPG